MDNEIVFAYLHAHRYNETQHNLRGLIGTFHHVSEQHLDRYVGEFAFRYNNRDITDGERAAKAAKAIKGKQ